MKLAYLGSRISLTGINRIRHRRGRSTRANAALPIALGLLAFASSLEPANAATTVEGSVSGSWTEAGSPYLVVGDILVASGNSLIIQSNVQVSVQGPYVFEVDGVLQAAGTPDHPIVFARAEANVAWEGIFFNGSSSSSFLTHCQVYGSENSGIRIANTTPAIRNCVIANNSSGTYGGGLKANLENGTLILDHCTITNNQAPHGGGASIHGKAELNACLVAGNRTPSGGNNGGGLHFGLYEVMPQDVEVTLRNCKISGNQCGYTGGGIAVETYTRPGTLRMFNCMVASNSVSSGYGGGLFAEAYLNAQVVNCTFVGNNPAAIHMWHQWDNVTVVTNSILYYNNAGGAQTAGNVPAVYSDIQGVQPGSGNISLDPSLDPSTLMPRPGSPCIDTGHPNSAFNDTCFPPSLGGVRNDIGAFGGPGACGWLDAPTIVSQPQDQIVRAGSNATFAAMATGAPPLSYQWLFNGETISGATTTNYIINSVQVADAGRYSVVVSNPAGSVTSVVAVLTVQVPHAATATATVVNGFVVGATVTDGGVGYTNTPSVRIIGGGGSGAQAVAVVSSGEVTAVNILNPGKDYTNTPVIVVAPPFIPPPTIGVAALSLLSFTNLAVGTNYQLESFSGSLLSTVGPPFTASSSTFTQWVSGTVSTNSYRLTTTPAPTQAQATAQVVNGFVVGAVVTSGGSGYTTSPAVLISGGGGTNATAVATVTEGSVTGISITSPGMGYTSTPAIIIALPPTASLWPDRVTQVMKLRLEDLSPYDNYQLEFTPSAAGDWSNLHTPFIPTSATSIQYIDASGDAAFFRVRYVP